MVVVGSLGAHEATKELSAGVPCPSKTDAADLF